MSQYIAPRFMTHRTEEGQGVQIKRLSARHYALMDTILANPRATLGEIATLFGVTQAWLSTVYHSDLFQAVLNDRRNCISGDFDRVTVAKLRNIADKGLDTLTDALDDEETPLTARQNITEMALKGLGILGAKAAAPSVVINNSQTVVQERPGLADAVQAARARIQARNAQPLRTADLNTPITINNGETHE
ncbi:MAG: hypothetical protein [Siphoviridae sp. ct7UA22]|nr:MAG: hypothetical protein [Siphoviridae sp. ct7UA22]